MMVQLHSRSYLFSISNSLILLIPMIFNSAIKSKSTVQFSSVTQSCPALCDPMNRSTPGLPVHHQLPEFTQTYVHRVGDAIQPPHLHPLLLLPPIPPSIRVFSNGSTLCMRWPNYWSFSFSISPSKEIPGLISFRMDCMFQTITLITNERLACCSLRYLPYFFKLEYSCLQQHCCVSFCCTAKWISHTYTYIPLLWFSFPFRSPQITE